ncbi:MAG: hypothetical protein AAB768_02115 [Patescibacteria group bacterium]
MSNEDRGGKHIDLEALSFSMDDQLARSGRSPIDVWEGQLKTEPIQLTSDLRPAVEQYVDTIIGVTRMGSLRPDEYAHRIIEENQGLPSTWRFYSESAARVHDRMVEEAKRGNDEIAQGVATTLSTDFMGVIQRTGIRHEGDMGRTMRGLLDKFKRFPQEPK